MKTILITGSTDGIGQSAAKMIVNKGHKVIVHGRSQQKVSKTIEMLKAQNSDAKIDGFVCDLSTIANVENFAKEVKAKYDSIDVLINNAGVFVAPAVVTADNLDLRFAVNTVAPYLLTKRLISIIAKDGRVVNLSSAAQSSVDIDALLKSRPMSDNDAYAQSKLALTMFTRYMAMSAERGVQFVSVNPKSFLGSKMVKTAYGMEGHDISIGGDILTRAALSDDFADSNGKYFDNDRGMFAMPHPDAVDEEKCGEVVEAIEQVIRKK